MNHLGKTSDEVRQFGRQLMSKYGTSDSTFEAVADHILQDIYREFVDERGRPLFALLRTFRLCVHADLPPDLRPTIDPGSGKHWLALVATVGQEAAWNDRRQSKGHRAIPAGAFDSPMLKAAFQQLQLTSGHTADLVEAPKDMVMIKESISFTRYFYVEKALGNPNIVDQDTFVKPYGIQSVMGLGCMFVSRALHITLFFSKTPLKTLEVELLMQLSPFISSLLAIHDEKKHYWNEASG